MHPQRLIALVLALCAGPLYGATYYVSENGDDSPAGSKAAPWETIQHAVDQLKPGDTATVLPGTYREKIEFNNSGK